MYGLSSRAGFRGNAPHQMGRDCCVRCPWHGEGNPTWLLGLYVKKKFKKKGEVRTSSTQLCLCLCLKHISILREKKSRDDRRYKLNWSQPVSALLMSPVSCISVHADKEY